jgi:uncharacterized protein
MDQSPATRGPLYLLQCEAHDGTPVTLRYWPHTSELTDSEGIPLLRDRARHEFLDAERVAPECPGWKSAQVHTLKIQLGLRCNYSCSYCNQSSAVQEATVSRTADADAFLESLDHWLQAAPERIEFWGGEPLVYFAKLKRLVPSLRARFPRAVLFMVSNGSLVDEEVLEFIERWDLHVAISHDGPGQHLRGPDPFEDPTLAESLRKLSRRRKGRMSFHAVLTPSNSDIVATRNWFVQRLGDESVTLDTEGVVSVYDDASLAGAGHWNARDYERLRAGIVSGFSSGVALRYRAIQDKARDFIRSLQAGRPSSALWQKCGMDQPNQIAVDLQGNVLTCQNTGAGGKHRIGHVEEMDQVELSTATHWSHRESCRFCPVVQLCKGGCMYLEGEHFAQTCENEYHFNLAILEGVLQQVCGLRLTGIKGDIRRPARRRRIPIQRAA